MKATGKLKRFPRTDSLVSFFVNRIRYGSNSFYQVNTQLRERFVNNQIYVLADLIINCRFKRLTAANVDVENR